VEGINILETDDLIVDSSDLTIRRVLPDASVTEVTDVSRVDVTTYNNGSIVVRTLNGDIDLVGGNDASVRAFGPPVAEGNILIEAIAEDTSINIYKNVIADSGDVSLVAALDITSFNTASIATNILGTIDLEATKGTIELSQGTDISNYRGDIHLFADNDIFLGGQIRSDKNVKIVANSGSVFDQVRDGNTDIVASGLVIEAGSAIGQNNNDLEFTVDEATIQAGRGRIYLMANQSLTLTDSLSNAYYRVAPDASTQLRTSESEGNAIDTPSTALLEVRSGDLQILDRLRAVRGLYLHLARGSFVDARGAAGADILADEFALYAAAIGSSGNPVELQVERFAAESFAGGIFLEADDSVEITEVGDLYGATANGGNIEIEAEGTLTIDAIRSTETVRLTSLDGAIVTGKADAEIDIEAGVAELNAVNGLGTSGAGDLNLQVEMLTFINSGVGSAYFRLLGAETTVNGAELADKGSLFIDSLAGDVTFSGTTSIFAGTLSARARGVLTISGDVFVSGGIKLLGTDIVGSSAYLLSNNGDLSMRAPGDIRFDSNSVIAAPNGRILTTSGGLLELGGSSAGVDFAARAVGDLSGSTATFKAPKIRLFSAMGSIIEFNLLAFYVSYAAPHGSVAGLSLDSGDDDFFRRQIFGDG
jgi:hypothetical protein